MFTFLRRDIWLFVITASDNQKHQVTIPGDPLAIFMQVYDVASIQNSSSYSMQNIYQQHLARCGPEEVTQADPVFSIQNWKLQRDRPKVNV